MKKFITSVTFIMILGLAIGFIFLPKSSFSYNENRYLKKMPEFSMNALFNGKYFEDLSSYVTDNFPFRLNFINLKTQVLKLMGTDKIEDVYYGKNGELYQEYSRDDSSDTIIKRINNFITNNEGINVDIIISPTAISIEKDNISKYNTNYDENITLDYYKDNLKGNFIDIRDVLEEHKDEYLFYKTDHHWTTMGAHYAYLEYASYKGFEEREFQFEKVNDKFYGTLYSKVLDNSLSYDEIYRIKVESNVLVSYLDTESESNSLYNSKWLEKKDKYSYFLDGNHSLIKIDNLDNSNGRRLLIVKDSYANSFVPFIVSDYDEIVIVDPRYYKKSISDLVSLYEINDVLFLYNILTIDDDFGIKSIK